jgi:hypothetical protein
MRLVIYDGVRYLLASHTAEAISEFHRQLPQIKADIQGMRDSQSEEQKWFHRQDSWDIKEAYGITTVIVHSSSKELEVVEKKRIVEYPIISYVIGLEYTDGTYPGYEWIWPLYNGSGVSIGTIAGGEFITEVNLPWGETAALHGPWKRESSANEDGYIVNKCYFFNYAVDGEKYLTLGTTKFEQLEEVEYDAGVLIKIYTKFLRTWPDDPLIPDTVVWEFIDTTTTMIKIGDKIIAGPFTYVNHHRQEFNTVTSLGTLIDNYLGERVTYSGLGGLAVSEDHYLCLYCKQVGSTYGTNSGPVTGPRADFAQPNTYTGNITYESHVNYAEPGANSIDIITASRAFNINDYTWIYLPACARIFKVNDTNFIYLYSFINPTIQDIDTDEYLEEPTCHYGSIIFGNNSSTTVGYLMILDGNDFDTANIVEGLPEIPVQLYSSILMRAFMKTEIFTREE